MHFASYYRWLVYRHIFGLPSNIESLLDVGCGDGNFNNHISASVRFIVDLDLNVLRQSRFGYQICADGSNLPLGKVKVDLAIMSDVIEHVVTDAALVAGVIQHIKPGGLLWLSTTAHSFQLFPSWVTKYAERSWGHVRKGYNPDQISDLVGSQFSCNIIEWPEVALRHNYLLLWFCSKRWPRLANILAQMCFHIDCKNTSFQRKSGHLYLQARRIN